MFSFGIVVDSILFVLGIFWCKFVFARLPSDMTASAVPETDRADRRVIAFLWIVTAVVIFWMVRFVIGFF